jgi:hypothetical protein
VNTITTEPVYLRTDKIFLEFVTDEYNVDFDLVITSESGTEVYNGKITNLNSVTITDLEPGTYTCVLSSTDFDDVTQYATVIAGETATVSFNGECLLKDK